MNNRTLWAAIPAAIILTVALHATATAAARVTPGTAYIAAQGETREFCAHLDRNSEVPGLAQYNCYSFRVVRSSCRTHVLEGKRRGYCSAVLRHGIYAPGGIDSLWKNPPAPCWRLFDGLYSWAKYRALYSISVSSTRRELHATRNLYPVCRVLDPGNGRRV